MCPPIRSATAGGPPHATAVYTGKHVEPAGLAIVAQNVFLRAVGHVFVLDQAVLSSFTKDDGTARHDVLLMIKNPAIVEEIREAFRMLYPERIDKFYMGEPHVTAATCASRAEAEAALIEMRAHLPMLFTVSGVYIDS